MISLKNGRGIKPHDSVCNSLSCVEHVYRLTMGFFSHFGTKL